MITVTDELKNFIKTSYDYLNQFNTILPSSELTISESTEGENILANAFVFEVTFYIQKMINELNTFPPCSKKNMDCLIKTVVVDTLIHELKHVEQHIPEVFWDSPKNAQDYTIQQEWENEKETVHFIDENLDILEKKFGPLDQFYLECQVDLLKEPLIPFSKFPDKDIRYKRITDPLEHARSYLTNYILKNRAPKDLDYRTILQECDRISFMFIPSILQPHSEGIEFIFKENGIWDDYKRVNTHVLQLFKLHSRTQSNLQLKFVSNKDLRIICYFY